MRLILVLSMLGTLLLLPTVNFAQTDADCPTVCSNEKTARDENCPPSAETAEDTGEDTDKPDPAVKCLQASQDTYDSCIDSCLQSAPTDTSTEN